MRGAVVAYIRDDRDDAVTLEVARDVRVTRVACPDSCRDRVLGDIGGLARSFSEEHAYTLADPYRGAQARYWLTAADGRVVAIDEQYLP